MANNALIPALAKALIAIAWADVAQPEVAVAALVAGIMAQVVRASPTDATRERLTLTQQQFIAAKLKIAPEDRANL